MSLVNYNFEVINDVLNQKKKAIYNILQIIRDRDRYIR